MGRGKAKGDGKVKEVKGTAGFTEVEDAHSKLISAIDEQESCTPVRKDWCWRLRCDSIHFILFRSSSTR